MNQDEPSPQPAQVDPYELTPDAVQDPPRTMGDTLKQIGPGLILTASIVGTGELIATTNLGAKAGFLLLWLVLLSCFIKVFVQIELGRYAISSGDTTLGSFHRIPHMGPLLSWWWFIMMLCTQFQIGAMIGGCSHCVHMAVPDANAGMVAAFEPVLPGFAEILSANPEWPYAVIITLLTIVLLVRGRYHVVERTCTILVALFTLLTVLCVVMLPWATMSPDQAHPAASSPIEIDPSAVWIAAFAMIGITGVGASELIAYPYWCLEKRYARYIGPREETESWKGRALGWLRVMHTDAWLSMIIYTLATLAFYVLGASVLFAHTRGAGLSGDAADMLNELAKMYEPVLGVRGSIWFIAIGGFIVLYSTLFAATAGNSRVTTDFLRTQQLIPFSPPEFRHRWIRFFSAALPLLGFTLYLFVGNPVQMVVIGGVAQALTLPMIAAVAIYLRMRHTDKRLIKHGIWDYCLWISLLMFAIAAAYGIWDQIQKMM